MPLSFILHQSCGHFDAFCIWMTKNGLHNKRWITGRSRKKMAYAFVRETVRKQLYFPGCCSICASAGNIWATSCYQQRLPTTTFLKRGMLESWPCHVKFILFKLMISTNSHKYHVSASKIKKKNKICVRARAPYRPDTLCLVHFLAFLLQSIQPRCQRSFLVSDCPLVGIVPWEEYLQDQRDSRDSINRK